MAEKMIRVLQNMMAKTDIVRLCVISSLTICCTLITAVSFSRSINFLSYQLFFIPILYAAYFYPKRGLLVALICGVAYQTVGYYYCYPSYTALIAVTSEAILFVLIASLIAYFIEKIRTGEARYRSVFEHSQLGIALFNRTDFAIRQTNTRFPSMLDYTNEEINGMTFSSLFLTSMEKERFLERISKTEATENFEVRLGTKSGEGCWVNLSWNTIDETTISCTAVNINGRKIAEKLNNDNMMKYRQLTENSPNGILLIQGGYIRFSNPSFTLFSGYSKHEVTGKTLENFVYPHDREVFCNFIKNEPDNNNKNHEEMEIRFVTKTGGIRSGALSANSITHLEKPAMMINIIDISEKQRLSDKILEDNERRRGIIITVAHELRTPLQPILGYLNLLISDPEGFGIVEETKKILERCLTSVDRERQIINQMLDLSVLESGKLKLSYSTFPLESLVKSVLDTSGYYSKADVTVDIPDSVQLTADKDRIYSVIESLLSNAVNYSKPPRNIKIFYCSEADDTQHHLSIQDNGIGIEKSVFSSIFEPFQLADAAKLSRRYDRIGLSLSIAKKVILMHSGDITVESTVNAGSTFTIHLPKEMQNAP